MMFSETQNKYFAAVEGAGPAGLYAARKLASAGVQVAILNRDIKPGGVAEYGIYPSKYKIKGGLRNQFHQILASPGIKYYGNVSVGNNGDITLDELRAMGFQAVLALVGAQGTKWLNLPGEELSGVYHAKDIVYHYNKLPPFSKQEYLVCCRVALIGVGNVMIDIAHWLIRDLKVNEVVAIARRGPAEVKFSRKEMEYVIGNLDLEAFKAEINRVAPIMQDAGQDVQASKDYILSALPRAQKQVSKTRFRFEFLTSPTRILGDDTGKVIGIEVENNTLVVDNGESKVLGLGSKRIVDVDAVIFCIGDKVDLEFGLPVDCNEYVTNPEPRFPIDGSSYEAYDPGMDTPIEGIFLAGWSREASKGLVGVARKDGENAAAAMLQYLHTLPGSSDSSSIFNRLEDALKNSGKEIVTESDVAQLVAVEQAEADRLGLEDFKMDTNEEMLAAIGR
jgi:ferredoxin--NADP+ reductase